MSDAETTEMHAGGRWPDLRAELDNQPPLLWQREREGRANEFGVACPSASLAPGRRVAAGRNVEQHVEHALAGGLTAAPVEQQRGNEWTPAGNHQSERAVCAKVPPACRPSSGSAGAHLDQLYTQAPLSVLEASEG